MSWCLDISFFNIFECVKPLDPVCFLSSLVDRVEDKFGSFLMEMHIRNMIGCHVSFF